MQSEIQKRGIAIPPLYVIGGKSCVRVCNLNQRSQRSDFEALVQACEQLGAELEARTGHKAVQHVKIRRGGHDDDDGGRTGAPKAFSRQVTESCADGTIIVIIMNLCNFLSGIRI